jgi:IMP dehydrogenase/GMP reductase
MTADGGLWDRVVVDSHALAEFLLLPGLTRRDALPEHVDLSSPLVRFRAGEQPAVKVQVPFASAMMQSVTDHRMACALARRGGIGFVFGSQTPADQADMVSLVKQYRPSSDSGWGPTDVVDGKERLVVGAAVNTRDYRERVPALVGAGIDVLCVDASDGYSELVGDVLEFVRDEFGDEVRIGAGNVVHGDAFRYLAEAGADFVKIGIGGGAVALTREQKGTGCGQATAIMVTARERDAYFRETGLYVPLCSDGGVSQDYHIALALAMGADFVMMGRYFARFDESPGRIIKFNLYNVKEYWGEGSSRAQTQHHMGVVRQFEEGVDAYVPYAGAMAENMDSTVAKMRSILSGCGARNLAELRSSARFVKVSPAALREGSPHDVTMKRTDTSG